MPGGLEKLHGLSPFLAWCLSSSLLISLSLCLFFIRCSPTFFALLPLFTHHLSHSSVLFSLLCLSLSISGCHRYSVAFFTSLPCDIPLFLFLRPLSPFLAMPLLLFSFFLTVSLWTHRWHSPRGSRWISMTGPGPRGSCWPDGPQQKRSVLRRAPP